MKLKEIQKDAAIFLITYHLIFLIGFPTYLFFYSPNPLLWVIAFVFFLLTGFSITGGYHRYFSHRSFKASSLLKFLFLFFGAMAVQGSALRWAFEHRIHHAFVDTDRDPYSIKRGFFYAHFLWLLEKPQPIDEKVVSDLVSDKMVMFQFKHYYWLFTGLNIFFSILAGGITGDFLGAFFIVLLGRVFLLHHCTWFINSLAHTWGSKPFSNKISAVNNYWFSFLTFGEGNHNYHHTFASDYRSGTNWYDFDPTKWLIWTFSKLRLASDLRKIDQITIQKKAIQEVKIELEELLAINKNVENANALSAKLNGIYTLLNENISTLNHLKAQIQGVSQKSLPKLELAELNKRFKAANHELKNNLKFFNSLERQVKVL